MDGVYQEQRVAGDVAREAYYMGLDMLVSRLTPPPPPTVQPTDTSVSNPVVSEQAEQAVSSDDAAGSEQTE